MKERKLKKVISTEKKKTLLRKRQKQTTLDQFLVLKMLSPSETEASPTRLQSLPRRERTPDNQISDVLME